jgi:MFS transporter, CP family, cyanate transporter
MPPEPCSTFDPSQLKYRWVMLAGLWLAYASFGMIIGGIPPLVVYLSEDLNLSRSSMGSVMAAWPLVYIAFAIPAGALIDRFGLRISITLGIILISLSGLLRALAVNYTTLFVAVAIFGLGGPFISIGAPKLISIWFGQKDRGTAMGIYLTAPAIGRIAALATANSLLMPLYDASWRLTLGTYAGVAFLAGVVWWVLGREVPNVGATPQNSSATLSSSFKVFPLLLRIWVVRIVLLMSFGSFLFNHGLYNWLPEILRAGGMTAAQAGLWATLPVAIGIVATVIIPRLAIPSRRIPMLAAILITAAASAMIIGTSTGALLTIGLVLAAASRGLLPIIMLVLMDLPQVGSQRMGAAGGLFFTAGEVGGVLGPLLLGVAADATGGFGGGLLILAVSNVLLAFLAVWLGAALKRNSSMTPPDIDTGRRSNG